MSEITDSTGYLLLQAAKAHRGRVAAALAELDLHVGQELVLEQLWREEGLIQTELSDRLGVERHTVTKVLKGLEGAGLVVREPDPADARARRIYLTEAGRSLREPVEEAWSAINERMEVGLTVEERIVLRRLLEQVRNNLS